MKRKLTWVLLLSLLLCAVAFSASVELKFLHRWTQEPDSLFFDEVARDFEQLYPNIKVNVQSIANDPFKEKIKVLLGTSDAPDVFFTWPGEFTNRFIRADRVLDLTPYLLRDGSLWNYVGSQVEPFVYQGKIYGLPYRLDAKVFVYNKELFQKAGITKAPVTFAELIDACKKLKAAKINQIAFGNEGTWAVSHYIGAINQKSVPEDVWLKDLDPAQGVWTHPGYVESLKIYSQLVPYFNPFANGIKHDQARIEFMAGKFAMMYLEIVEIPEILREAPTGFGEKIGVFVFPDTKGPGDPDYLVGYPEGFVVSADTKYPEEAVAFLKYLTGREAGRKEIEQLGFFNGYRNVVGPDEVLPIIYETTSLILNSKRMVNWLDSDLHAKIWDVYSVQLQMLTDLVATPENVMKEIQKIATEVRKEF
ncbi:MAG TPA: extracellular solute-binding protein [Thermotogota bacterium]|nr:extracellular solute-binding protein [Thermotogota bacterium]HOZ13049.1 extracellular solute-binding protein [Thermotogota bacterium]HPH10752.1 extracellular solute-binding protein [Thermotogota bacterium]HPM21843.1 extracellular solute-binding protein [Thermotogota bacterium]